MNKNILKSIGAVVAGFASVALLSIATDFLLMKTGAFPPQSEQGSYLWWMLLIALIYRCLYGAAGGFLTASLAPGRPMRYVIILGVAGFVFGLLGTIANWDKVTPSTEWYPMALIVLTIPSVVLGGKLKARNPETPHPGKAAAAE